MNMIHKTQTIDRRTRKRAQKTAEILSVAQSIMEGGGSEALTMPVLAAELDCAVGGIYRYFTNKEALITALQIQAIASFAERLDVSMQQCPTGLERVKVAWNAWRDFAMDEPVLHGLVDAMLSSPAEVLSDEQDAEVRSALEPVLERVAHALALAESQGQLSPGNTILRTHALWAALHGVDHFRKRDRRGGPHSEQIAATLLDALLTGWGA